MLMSSLGVFVNMFRDGHGYGSSFEAHGDFSTWRYKILKFCKKDLKVCKWPIDVHLMVWLQKYPGLVLSWLIA